MKLWDCHDAKPGGSKQSMKSWTYLEIPLLPEKEERRDTDRLRYRIPWRPFRESGMSG